MYQNIYLCEDTVESIFTAIFLAWASKNGHQNNKIVIQKENYNQELFAHYIFVKEDKELAEKVARSISKKISEEAYEMVMKAIASYKESKADAIYRFLILGFAMGKSVVHYITYDNVNEVFKLSRSVGNEVHHYLGFLRFEELDNFVLLAKIRPQNDILTMIAPHFADRFQGENFMIADVGRNKMVFHVANKDWFCTEIENLSDVLSELNYSKKEESMQKLWKHFVDTIGIEERYNHSLQRQMLPLHFREFLPEFQKI